MQPYKILNNVQKARLLHALMADEIPAFISYLKGQCENIRQGEEELRANWKDQLFGPDLWIELAVEAEKKITRYGRELHKSSTLFADQLFDGYTAIFTAHQLIAYTATGQHTDPKFKQAVDLLFT